MSQMPPNPPPNIPPGGPPPPGGQPPPPGWNGPPPTGPQGRPKGNRTGVFILIGVLVVVLGVGAYLLTSGGDDDGGGGASSPEDAVRGFFEAAEDGDCEALVDLVTEESWGFLMTDFDPTAGTPEAPTRDEAVADCREQAEEDDDLAAGGTLEDVEVISQEGDTATVNVITSEDGEESEAPITVVNQDGWKLDFAAILGDIDAGG